MSTTATSFATILSLVEDYRNANNDNGETTRVWNNIRSELRASLGEELLPRREPLSPWISVKDRLPTEKAEYVHNLLVACSTYGCMTISSYDGYAKYFEMNGVGLGGHEPTHWMPLPAAPLSPSSLRRTRDTEARPKSDSKDSVPDRTPNPEGDGGERPMASGTEISQMFNAVADLIVAEFASADGHTIVNRIADRVRALATQPAKKANAERPDRAHVNVLPDELPVCWIHEWGAVSLPVGDPSRITCCVAYMTEDEAMKADDECEFNSGYFPVYTASALLASEPAEATNQDGISARGPIQEPDRVQVLPPPLAQAADRELPPPDCTYADHSYPAYSRKAVLAILAAAPVPAQAAVSEPYRLSWVERDALGRALTKSVTFIEEGFQIMVRENKEGVAVASELPKLTDEQCEDILDEMRNTHGFVFDGDDEVVSRVIDATLAALSQTVPAVASEPPKLPPGQKMGSATINGKYVEIRMHDDASMLAYGDDREAYGRSAALPSETKS